MGIAILTIYLICRIRLILTKTKWYSKMLLMININNAILTQNKKKVLKLIIIRHYKITQINF